MNVDISPDGKTIVFDLLGDIYTLPDDGGRAIQLTRGLAYNRCPVWRLVGIFTVGLQSIFGVASMKV